MKTTVYSCAAPCEETSWKWQIHTIGTNINREADSCALQTLMHCKLMATALWTMTVRYEMGQATQSESATGLGQKRTVSLVG